MDTTPPSLLQRLREPDDTAAWERFVELYTPLVYSWACRMGLQQNDVDDLVQEVFAALLQKMAGFEYDQGKSFRSWLRTVTLNRWRDMCRRRASALRGGSADDLDSVVVPDGAAAVWEAEYRQHVAARALRVMQREFQDTTWRACWELIVNDRPAAEVASELGLTVDAVYAARYRVLRRLRQELAGLLE